MDRWFSKPARIPSLDGLRAISISLVIIAHLNESPANPDVLRSINLAELGVRMFFAISGFLITSLLLKEVEERGRVDLARFYFRRTLRIFPPYYVFLGTLALLYAFSCLGHGPGENTFRGLAVAALYVSNYRSTESWYAGHSWSLAVEEQFYLLWPAALSRLGTRRAFRMAWFAVLGAPFARLAVRLANHLLHNQPGEYLQNALWGRTFETSFDALALGCLLAGHRARLHGNKAYRRFLGSGWMALVPSLIVALSLLPARPGIWNVLQFTLGRSLVNVGLVLCLDWGMTYPERFLGRLLNARPLAVLGILSYSLYLWQQLFLNPYTRHPLLQFPWNVGFAILAALLSYLLVESPALRFRQAFEGRLFRPRPPAEADPSPD